MKRLLFLARFVILINSSLVIGFIVVVVFNALWAVKPPLAKARSFLTKAP
ncbi:hypothetical protein HPHPP41_1095 [Helicobacter pylori Hp P-41]|nr:hypothetical protein HPHPP41_1095 [Helicobacter pylori Hp P-41]